MAKYFTAWDDFDVDTIGTNVAGWTVRNGTPSRAPAYSAASTIAYKARYLNLSAPVANVAVVSWDAIDADANRANFDIVTCIAWDLLTASQPLIYARGQAHTDWYRLNLYASSIGLDKSVASAVTFNIGTASVTFAAGKNYFVRFRGNGTTLQVRVWDAALGRAGEPSTWNINITDSSVTAAGWIGLGTYHATLANRVTPFNFLAVGTNGDSAVCPRTNTERSNWLAGRVLTGESGMRAVLAKAKVTGYDSSGSPYTADRKVYMGNHGYMTHAQDSPANQLFEPCILEVPTFSREMPTALAGIVPLNIGRLRVANPAALVPGSAYLLLDGSSGCNATTPDAAALDITGDLDVDGYVAADDWTPGAVSMVLAKWQAAGNLSYRLYINTTGTLVLHWTADGSTILSAASSVATGLTDGFARYVRATLDVNDGAGNRVIKFYTSFDGVTWTQLGTTTTTAGTTSIFSGNSKLEIGSSVNGTQERLAGKVYRARVYNGIRESGGTLVADFNLSKVRKGATTVSAPTGETWTINGTAAIRQNQDTVPGVRDDWARMHWIRDGFEMLLGDPTWPFHDFMTILRGRIGDPLAPEAGVLDFAIADFTHMLRKRLVTDRVASGDYADQFKAKLFGQIRAVELQGDRATLVYQVSDGPVNSILADEGKYLYDVTPTAFAFIGTVPGLTITAVNTGTDTLTASAAHGMVAGTRVQFNLLNVNPPPGGLSPATNYYVIAAGLTSTDFRLSTSPGGAAENLTTADLGADFQGYGYSFDTANGTVTLVSPPVGRVIGLTLSDNLGTTYVTDVIEEMLFTALGLSENFKDTAKFNAALVVDITDGATAGYHIPVGVGETAEDALGKLVPGCRAWLSQSPAGLIQTGSVALPAATAVLSFTQSEIRGLRLTGVVRPVDFSQVAWTCAPWFLVGGPVTTPGVNVGSPFNVTSQEALQGRKTIAPATYSAAGIPLDDHPDQADANTIAEYALLTSGPSAADTRLKNFHLHKLGIFEFDATLAALDLSIGDTISLDFPRLGWKQWTSADPASPDNTATVDSRLAVVMGMSVNLSAPGPFKVHLKVFRRMPGYYPTANPT